MKRHFRIYACAVLLPLMLLGSSCNDWLDVKPQQQVESEDLFSREKGFEDALIACYIKMNSTNLYGRNLTMTFIEYLAQHWDFSSGNGQTESKIKNFEYTIEDAESTIRSIYSAMYNVIIQANSVLENLETHGDVFETEGIREMIEAEALSVRAFCHFDILRMFGQLPQNATVQVQLPYAKEVTIDMIPYYSYDQFVDLIFEDLNAAQALLTECDPVLDYTFDDLDNLNAELKDSFMGYRRFRFNYWAVEALKARIYLYLGDKDNARIAANNVINAKTEDGESMISLSVNNDFSNGYYTCPSECIFALSANNIEDYIRNLFNNNSNYLTEAHYNQIFEGQDVTQNLRAINIWERTRDAGGTQYYDFRKYRQPGADDVPDSEYNKWMLKYQVIPLIRLSEMYLIAMETATSLSEANALYKTYMTARDVPVAKDLTQTELDAEILKEYRREFWGEGQMFYTYKRLGTEEMLWKTDRTVTENDYIVPLPSSELAY